MSAEILDGKALRSRILKGLTHQVASLKQKYQATPYMINIMVGQNSSSCAYAKSQERIAQDIGIKYECLRLPEDTSLSEIISHIHRLNDNGDVNGIMIHKPFPQNIDYQAVANEIDMRKDLEGINVANIGRILLGADQMIPCTPAAVMEHIHSIGKKLYGKEAVIIGASEIVGKPLALLLLREMATVTVCHIATSDVGHLKDHIKRAEILIVAVGKAGLVKGEDIKEGAIVIDVGINKVGDSIVGDVEYEKAFERAGYITPVPGGVGPVTVVMLMRNVIEAFKMQKGIG